MMIKSISITKVPNEDGSCWSFESANKINDLGYSLIHGVTYREGGVSHTPFASLNLGLHVGDCTEDVLSNRAKVANYLGVDTNKITCASQVHGLNCVYVDEKIAGTGANRIPENLDCDALYTDKKGIPLFLLVADCVPVLLYDAVHRVVAVVHAGWRGAIGHLPVLTLDAMNNKFGTKIEDCYAYLGPSIGGESFEVSEDLAQQFIAEGKKIGLVSNDIVKWKRRSSKDIETPHVNLWNFICQDLQQKGMIFENITTTTTDSLENKHCFSYRREDGKTGRMGLFAMLK